MKDDTTAKAAGKGIPCPNSVAEQPTKATRCLPPVAETLPPNFETLHGLHRDPNNGGWRDLWKTDIVIVGDLLVQIIATEGAAAIVAPLMNVRTGIYENAERRIGVQKSDCQIVPLPPLPARQPYSEKTSGARDWISEFQELLDLLRDHVDPWHPVRQEFEETERENSYDTFNADKTIALRVVGKFDELPEKEQRVILNGWPHYPRRPTAEEIEPGSGDARTRLAVQVHSLNRGGGAYAEWQIDDMTIPASVTVYANTTKAEVMKSLRETLDYIDANWTQVQGTKPHPRD